MRDQVDRFIEEWRRERPDLDSRAMATIGRLLRAAALIGEQLDWHATERGHSRPEGDVLLTLRRSGAPYRLDQSTLARSLVLNPGGLASRLEQLERQGLVLQHGESEGHPAAVELTDAGKQVVDDLLPDHIAHEERLLAPLTNEERETLDRLLATLVLPLESR